MKQKKQNQERPKIGKLSYGLRLVIVGVLIMFGLAFLMTAFSVFSRSKRDYEIRESETLLTGVAGSITATIDSYKALTRLILMDDDVLLYLRKKEPGHNDSNNAVIGIQKILNVTTDVDSVFIFRNDGDHLTTGKGTYAVDINKIQDWSWKHTFTDANGKAFVFIDGNDTIRKSNEPPFMSVIRSTYDLYNLKQTGLLIMNISSKPVLERIVGAQAGSELCIMSTDGTFFAGEESLTGYFSAEILSNKIVHLSEPEGHGTISGQLIKDIPLVVICKTRAGLESIPTETVVSMVILLATFLLSVYVSGRFVHRNITKPIYNMTRAMEKTKSSGWVENLDAEVPTNELGMLKDSFNIVITQQNELFNSLIEKEKYIQKAEVRVLQEQIKPHFLYNSLETINYMAMDAGAENVSNALETLGSFYRNFLNKGNREIPLKKEINIIQDYLSLQKLRYGDIINDEYDISPEAMDFMIPKLTLQPLVENSIYHGIRLTGEPGTISIRGYVEEEKLHLIVRDTGVGMSEEQIAEELSVLRTPHTAEELKQGFGLRGTIERIRYYCRDDNVIQIRSTEGEFTEIELIISPIIYDEEET